MDTIGFIAPKHGVGTSTLIAGLADAIAIEHGQVTVIDRGPNQTLTRRYQKRTDRAELQIAQQPAATGLTLIDCPPATDPNCLDIVNTCATVVVVTNTSADALDKLDALAALLRQTLTITLGIVITRTETDIYKSFDTLPVEYELPALTKIFDQACTQTSTIISHDHAHVTALNTSQYISELTPPRPDITNTFLRLNDELGVLHASATRANTSPPQHGGLQHGAPSSTPTVRGVTNLVVSRPNHTPAATQPHIAPVEESVGTKPAHDTPRDEPTKRREFRIYIALDDLIAATGLDLGALLTQGVISHGPALRAGEIPEPNARGKRRRRTCNLTAATNNALAALAANLGWSQTQLANAIVQATVAPLNQQ